mgnify:CR=1 FL=1
MKNEYVIELKPLGNKFMEVTIVGDSDLVLNKMNDVNAKQLIRQKTLQNLIRGKKLLPLCTGTTENLPIFQKKVLQKH